MDNNKRLLILNGSHSEIPLIQAAKKLGFYVITSGNIPELIGHKYSDDYCQADFSDPEAILILAKKLKIDAICSAANDFGIITASYVAEQLSLGGHDDYNTTLALHLKDLFKEFTLENNIISPKAVGYNNLSIAISDAAKYRYPLIIKPIDLTGGKGVSVVKDINGYKSAIEKAFTASRKKRIVVEEFIEGSQHSFSTFLVNKKVAFYFSDNEYSFLNPFLVSTSAAPADNVAKVEKSLIEATEKIAEILSLVDGIFHIQYIYNNEKAYILEITRRCSGDLYPYPVNYATGIDWAEWIVRAETGMDCSNFPTIKQKGFCGRHCIMSSENGTIKNIYIDKLIENNIYDKVIWKEQGDIISNYLADKAGVVMLKYDSFEEMHEKTAKINDLIKIIIE